ncbi:MAG: hypothetical protein ACK56I_23835, partial [bacterium]
MLRVALSNGTLLSSLSHLQLTEAAAAQTETLFLSLNAAPTSTVRFELVLAQGYCVDLLTSAYNYS